MKIISKYKDYYDYLVGIYGEDPKLILDRRSFTSKLNLRDYDLLVLHFAGKRYDGLYLKEKFYWGKDISKIFKLEEPKKKYSWNVPDIAGKLNYDPKDCIVIKKQEKYGGSYQGFITERDIKYKEHPCTLSIYPSKYSSINWNNTPFIENSPFPILSQIDFILDEKTCWLNLTQWLSDRISENEPEVPIGDDKTRIESHGFNLKTSFRPKHK